MRQLYITNQTYKIQNLRDIFLLTETYILNLSFDQIFILNKVL